MESNIVANVNVIELRERVMGLLESVYAKRDTMDKFDMDGFFWEMCKIVNECVKPCGNRLADVDALLNSLNEITGGRNSDLTADTVKKMIGLHTFNNVINSQEGDAVETKETSKKYKIPDYYNFPIEPVNAIYAFGLDFCLGNVLKYIVRAGKKPGADIRDDLEKAKSYIDMKLQFLDG